MSSFSVLNPGARRAVRSELRTNNPAAESSMSESDSWAITRTLRRDHRRRTLPSASMVSPSLSSAVTVGRDRFQAAPKLNSRVLNRQAPSVAVSTRGSGPAE